MFIEVVIESVPWCFTLDHCVWKRNNPALKLTTISLHIYIHSYGTKMPAKKDPPWSSLSAGNQSSPPQGYCLFYSEAFYWNLKWWNFQQRAKSYVITPDSEWGILCRWMESRSLFIILEILNWWPLKLVYWFATSDSRGSNSIKLYQQTKLNQ